LKTVFHAFTYGPAQIHHGHHATGDRMKDYCDEKSFSSHPIFSTALQVFLYFDELEVCNPLGSKTKTHKLFNSIHAIGNFYFTLGNTPPKYQSKLKSIQLLAIVKTKLLSLYGMDAILEPIVRDLKKLVDL